MVDFAEGDKYRVVRNGVSFILDEGKVVEVRKGTVGTVIRGQDSAGFLVIRFGKYDIPTVATDLTDDVRLVK